MANLGEIYKDHGKTKMNLKPIKDVLGEDTPDIGPHQLGRYRLIHALTMKFGANFRNLPKAKAALDHFDNEAKYYQALRDMEK